MSNLNRPYEISVWDNILVDGAFVERRLGVIGSNEMMSQSRAINPQLGRNVNGVKTFQFGMYRYYTDNITGEKVENPFVGWLVSERKVKLKYAEKWYDFIVKDIAENSSTYLYTYKLEDAAVIELSKNGFGVILDEQLNNNLGNPKTLAERTLENTDWKVDSEVFIQKVEDALVWLSIPAGTAAVHIKDQTDLNNGIQEEPVVITKNGANKVEILAFYSSCTNKPHRFQFIYLDDFINITTDKEGKINNTDCQYYIDFEPTEYSIAKDANNDDVPPYYLPNGFQLFSKNSGYLYTDARAERYGFAHQTVYIPKLDRYVYKYTKDNEPRYGYYDSEYWSPALIQSIITNSRFDSTSGWTGTRSAADGVKAIVRNVYGYFDSSNKFIDSADELLKGTFKPENKELAAYLEIKLDTNSLVLNSGPYDNRITIGNMEQGSEWQLEQEIYTADKGEASLSIQIGEYEYDSNDYYKSPQTPNITFSQDNPLYTVTASSYQEKTFKKDSNVRIAITGAPGTYYIKKFELFRRILDDDQKVIYPDNIVWLEDEQKWDGNVSQSVVKNTYRYFTQTALDNATDATDLVSEYTTETLSYATYKPVYNTGAEKVRTVSAKESNYFNILQSIAETFGAWLEIDVKHNEDGLIDKENKWIRFKNYVGKTNYANFRYGVNLKDIQRTYASKEIVTKLMVKPNSNQHATNGFCAIGRANSNPSGEDYIYDFRYFHERGLLDSLEYLKDVYEPKTDGDYTSTAGYYYKIKQLNTNITALNNEKIIPAQTNLTQLENEYAVAEAGYDAALEGIKEAREDFEQLFGFSIDNVSADCIKSVSIDKQNSYVNNWYNEDRHGHIWYQTTKGFEITKVEYVGKNIIITYNTTNTEEQKFTLGEPIYVELYPQLVLKYNNEKTHKILKTTIKPDKYGTSTVSVEIGGPIDEKNSAAINKMVEYTALRGNEKLYQNQKEELSQKITILKQELAKDEEELDTLKKNKTALNLAFFKKYSRFIQEGTWIDEKYSDNELYYADALSVMYNSCYPKVAYTINVLALNMLPGYEGFTFELGDTTYAEDYEFFGDKKEEVTITEFIEFLDEPDKDTIKVQNFKNQFRDLFQKITATVQQAQYSTGSYEKAVALAEANQTRKQQFLSDALNGANARLQAAGQQSVVWDNTGITITDVDTPSNQIRMIGGAILLKKQDKNGQEKWTTGITSDGISASLITAGTINAGEIAIMNADEPVFRWDAFGISAFDFIAQENDFGTTIGAINPNRFVRFDKYGIYGINGNADGITWHATSAENAEQLATFALTWEGLKVTGDGGGTAHIGKQTNGIITVKNNNGTPTFTIDEKGNVELGGNITWGTEASPTQVLYNDNGDAQRPTKPYTDYSSIADENGWKTTRGSSKFASYTYDGGASWTEVVQIVGQDGKPGIAQYSDWFKLLNDKSNKSYGIYKLNATGKVGINATVIESGALLIGDSAPTFENGNLINANGARFYADIDNKNVLINGDIIARSLTLGENVSIDSGNNNLIRGTGVKEGGINWVEANKWRSEYTDAKSSICEETGRLGTSLTITRASEGSRPDLGYGSNYIYTLFPFNKGDEYKDLFDFVPGAQYTFSCEVYMEYAGDIKNKPNNTKLSIGVCTSDWKNSIDSDCGEDVNNGIRSNWGKIGYSFNGKETGGWQRVSWTFTVREDYPAENALYDNVGIYIYDMRTFACSLGINGANSGRSLTIKFANIKLEKGTVPSAWSVAPEEAKGLFNPDMDSTYSWKFDPSTGVQMWQGKQITNGEIFRINDDGLYISGAINCDGAQTFKGEVGDKNIDNLVMKAGGNFGVASTGDVYCYYGSIGGWNINKNGLYFKGSGFLSGANKKQESLLSEIQSNLMLYIGNQVYNHVILKGFSGAGGINSEQKDITIDLNDHPTPDSWEVGSFTIKAEGAEVSPSQVITVNQNKNEVTVSFTYSVKALTSYKIFLSYRAKYNDTISSANFSVLQDGSTYTRAIRSMGKGQNFYSAGYENHIDVFGNYVGFYTSRFENTALLEYNATISHIVCAHDKTFYNGVFIGKTIAGNEIQGYLFDVTYNKSPQLYYLEATYSGTVYLIRNMWKIEEGTQVVSET